MARKWGDEATKDVVLDYSEKASGDSDSGTGTQPDATATALADLSLKSRIDADDDEEAEDTSDDEGLASLPTRCSLALPTPCMTQDSCSAQLVSCM